MYWLEALRGVPASDRYNTINRALPGPTIYPYTNSVSRSKGSQCPVLASTTNAYITKGDRVYMLGSVWSDRILQYYY